ncbi:cytochrome c oxidase subunit 1 [Trichinella pseudospiralis]|uniref:Cytochrome c oxidase subunit 1 n=1 Tax=Trichinella pseudospiralis TaxID=6337 RepID=A0A0V0XF42_TRIPS|nr:cytochrome c oxidase subunit 1 [Trichinella pseudospiralis]
MLPITTYHLHSRTIKYIHLKSTHHIIYTNYLPTRPSRWNHHTPNRPQFRYNLLRNFRRRRPHPISAHILILWTPRSLYPTFGVVSEALILISGKFKVFGPLGIIYAIIRIGILGCFV